MSNQMTKYEIWQPFLLAAMVAIGMIIGNKISYNSAPLVDAIGHHANNPIGRVEEIVRFIESRYVDSLDSDEILEQAIMSIIEDLDPHSVYVPPEHLTAINEQMNGSYRGIGVESFYLADTVRISKVLPGTPAEQAGILTFDKLLAINDSIVAGKNLEYSTIREMLRADGKEQIRVDILRNKETLSLEVKPEFIALHSSNVSYEIADGIGYIRIERFSANTYKEFMESLESLVEDEEVNHLIIDVRGNPGGYLPETVNILSQLFDQKGKLLVYTSGKSGRKTEYKTSGKNFFPLDKIVVLIDEGSASGSEIIAGALQDWDRGLIIGRRSFGKGLVQEQYKLNNGGAIRLTTARYYTPSGRSIQRSYEDKVSYDQDIHDRYRNGEMYSLDKMKAVDTTIYKTKILERLVYGGGGIYPDIYIPADSTYSKYETERITAYLPEYIYQIRVKKINLAMEQGLDVDKFWDYMKIKGIKVDSIKPQVDEHYLHVRLLSEFAYQENDQIAEEKILNEEDPFILKALEFIQSSKNLRDFSSLYN